VPVAIGSVHAGFQLKEIWKHSSPIWQVMLGRESIVGFMGGINDHD